MAANVMRYAGTLIPLLISLVFLYIFSNDLSGELTWERPTAYLIGAVSLILGAIALIKMARHPSKHHMSLFLITLIYQKVLLALTFLAVFGLAANELLPWVPHIPEVLLYPILVSSIAATAIVNFVLFFGRPRGWLEEPVDPVPFRQIIKDLGQKRDQT